jgi:hypothetical protein
MLFTTKTLLISTVTLSLFALSCSTLCKKRHGTCVNYYHNCSLKSCCEPLQTKGYKYPPPSGEYLLHFSKFFKIAAYCDMETDQGGWTVVMRRSSINSNFKKRYYHDYEDGFGELNGEFWSGLRLMHYLTSRTPQEMRLDMFTLANDTESTSHATYSNFEVQDEGENYTLSLGGFTGSDSNLTDSLSEFNGQPFIAELEKDRVNIPECVARLEGGWWYTDSTNCVSASVPGPPGTVLTAGISHLLEWYDPSIPKTPNSRQARIFQKYEMKIRPLNCFGTSEE